MPKSNMRMKNKQRIISLSLAKTISNILKVLKVYQIPEFENIWSAGGVRACVCVCERECVFLI